ncbi:hypothetical protein NDU88_004217 [Pleurodeles waltl]|uniref:Uncharacterized protein n=1 Tax=Pleurodeles waltl TaxID=8319 RepID=A0AAV7SI71_PLEWA|nr:hypothetical protein NDU88_004217 [Pleurodeles waltl]
MRCGQGSEGDPEWMEFMFFLVSSCVVGAQVRVVVKACLVVTSFGGEYELVMGANGCFEGGAVGCRGFLSPYFIRLAAFALGVLEFGGEPWGVLDVAVGGCGDQLFESKFGEVVYEGGRVVVLKVLQVKVEITEEDAVCGGEGVRADGVGDGVAEGGRGPGGL